MSIRKTLYCAALLLLAVAAGLFSSQMTLALWNSAEPSSAQVVRAADFNVQLAGQPMIVNGMSATITVPNPDRALTPTTPVYVAAAVHNGTNASGPFTVQVSAGKPIVSKASKVELVSALTVRTALMPASGDCAQADYSVATAHTTIAKGATATICIRASLPTNAPESLQQATAAIAVPITVVQLQPGG